MIMFSIMQVANSLVLTLVAPSISLFEIVSYFFLFDGALQTLLDQIGGFSPPEEAEHHNAREND